MARERVTYEQYRKAVAEAAKASKTLVVEARTVSKTSSGVLLFGILVKPALARVSMEHLECLGKAHVEAFLNDEQIAVSTRGEPIERGE